MGQWMQLLTLIMILRLIDFDWTLIFFFFSENWTKVLFAVLFATDLTTNLIRTCPQDNDLMICAFMDNGLLLKRTSCTNAVNYML